MNCCIIFKVIFIFGVCFYVNFECGFGVVDTIVFKKNEAKILGNTPWQLKIIDP